MAKKPEKQDFSQVALNVVRQATGQSRPALLPKGYEIALNSMPPQKRRKKR